MKTIKSQKLWSEALEAIAGGNMLLSKRPDLHLPGKWPVYFNKAKGCFVWDLDNNKFIDFLSNSSLKLETGFLVFLKLYFRCLIKYSLF